MISYLVAQALGGDDGDLIADTLVGVEVKGEAGVVAFCKVSIKFRNGIVILNR